MANRAFQDMNACVSVSHVEVMILFGFNRGQKPVRIWDRFMEKHMKLKVQGPSYPHAPSETLAEILVILYLDSHFFK